MTYTPKKALSRAGDFDWPAYRFFDSQPAGSLWLRELFDVRAQAWIPLFGQLKLGAPLKFGVLLLALFQNGCAGGVLRES